MSSTVVNPYKKRRPAHVAKTNAKNNVTSPCEEFGCNVLTNDVLCSMMSHFERINKPPETCINNDLSQDGGFAITTDQTAESPNAADKDPIRIVRVRRGHSRKIHRVRKVHGGLSEISCNLFGNDLLNEFSSAPAAPTTLAKLPLPTMTTSENSLSENSLSDKVLRNFMEEYKFDKVLCDFMEDYKNGLIVTGEGTQNNNNTKTQAPKKKTVRFNVPCEGIAKVNKILETNKKEDDRKKLVISRSPITMGASTR